MSSYLDNGALCYSYGDGVATISCQLQELHCVLIFFGTRLAHFFSDCIQINPLLSTTLISLLVLGNTQPSSLQLAPLEKARQLQQKTRVSRGGFNSSHVGNSATLRRKETQYSIEPFREQPCPDLEMAKQQRKSDRPLTGRITALELELKEEKEKNERLEGELDQLEKQKEEGFDVRDKQIMELMEQIRNFSGKKGSKSRKLEQRKDVVETINEFTKLVLFRTTKFAQPGANYLDDSELKVATTKVWHGIKDLQKLDVGPNKLTLGDFLKIYGPIVQKALSACRQCVQSRTAVCIKGK